ncbi:uncharacterized protein LOC124133797 isoform X2 [Haliotis rufescens]|uniref:uncharacterized protein LOC124133797 isoform X2 n=1 Tax=Haliotis rufescens TaxID=6454 RepID=UPI00201EA769|nr:uncharacterized protein LOC124133797 isoform X2 [Haliotis rufescens]
MVREELLVFIVGFTMVCGSGRLSLRLLSFNNPGGKGNNGNYCDGFSIFKHSPCDHQFTICLHTVHGSMDLNRCQYGRAVTGEVRDQDRTTFGRDIGGVRNPIVFRMTSLPPRLRIKVGIWDVDSSNAYDFVDIMASDTTLTPSPTEAGSRASRLLIKRRSSLIVDVKSYCDPNYYGAQCSVFCSPSTKGRYTCHPYTGAKTCAPGWYGMNCEVNVDDCASSPCLNEAMCMDRHRGYVCACADGFLGIRCEIPIPASSVPEQPLVSTQSMTATSQSATSSISTPGLIHGDTESSTASLTASSAASTYAVDSSTDAGGRITPTPALDSSTDISTAANRLASEIYQTAYTTMDLTSAIWPTPVSSWTESWATETSQMTVGNGSVSTAEETAPHDSCFPLYLEGKLGTKDEEGLNEKMTRMLRDYADLNGNFSVSCQFAYFKDEKGGPVTEVTLVITVDGQLLDTSQMREICKKIPTENLLDGFPHKMYLGSRFPMSSSAAQSDDQVLGMPTVVVIVVGAVAGFLAITAAVIIIKYRSRCRSSRITEPLNADSDSFGHFENQMYMQPHTITVADRATSID